MITVVFCSAEPVPDEDGVAAERNVDSNASVDNFMLI